MRFTRKALGTLALSLLMMTSARSMDIKEVPILSENDIKQRLTILEKKFLVFKDETQKLEKEFLSNCFKHYTNLMGSQNQEAGSKELSSSQTIWGATGLQFDLTQNTAQQFGNALNNPFFVNKNKNGILIPDLSIYTVLYLSQSEPTWNDQYNEKLANYFKDPNNQTNYFSLFCWQLSEKNMQQLAPSLSLNTSLAEIDLSGNNLGDLGTMQLATYLKNNKTLKRLNLGNNGMGEVGLEYLADALTVNRTLKSLRLDGDMDPNFYTQQSLAKLVVALKDNKVLEELDFSHVVLGGGSDTQIANLIKNNTIKVLGLSHCNFYALGAVEIAAALYGNTTLEVLVFSHNKIGDTGATAFANALTKNQAINIYLDLSGNKIGDNGAMSLSKAVATQSIWCFYLNDNEIGNIGALAIANALQSRQSTNNDFVYLMSLKRNKEIGPKTMKTFQELCNEKNKTFFEFWVTFYSKLNVIKPF